MDAIIEEFIAVRALLQALESCQCRDLAECAALLKDCRESGMQSSRLPNRTAPAGDYSRLASLRRLGIGERVQSVTARTSLGAAARRRGAPA